MQFIPRIPSIVSTALLALGSNPSSATVTTAQIRCFAADVVETHAHSSGLCEVLVPTTANTESAPTAGPVITVSGHFARVTIPYPHTAFAAPTDHELNPTETTVFIQHQRRFAQSPADTSHRFGLPVCI